MKWIDEQIMKANVQIVNALKGDGDLKAAHENLAVFEALKKSKEALESNDENVVKDALYALEQLEKRR